MTHCLASAAFFLDEVSRSKSSGYIFRIQIARKWNKIISFPKKYFKKEIIKTRNQWEKFKSLLCLSLSLSVCLSVCQTLSFCLCLIICLSISLSLSLSLSLSVLCCLSFIHFLFFLSLSFCIFGPVSLPQSLCLWYYLPVTFCFCLPLCVFLYIFSCLCFFVSISLSLVVFITLSLYLSIYLSICLVSI